MPADRPSSRTPDLAASDSRAQLAADVASAAPLIKTFAATTAVLVVALLVLLRATGGGQSFTTETLRRQHISQQAERIPDFDVTLGTGQRSTLKALLAPGGKVWLVDFVYIRCQTLCLSLGSVYQQLQVQIEARGLQGNVGLLSISFDPANDSPAALADYAKRMGMNPQIWQIATLTQWQDRRRLLDAFGIMVLPAPLGEFEHNAALHVVSSDALLTRIMDYADPQAALDMAASLAGAMPIAGRGPLVAAP
jgi:protein SCO1/2